MICTNSLYNKIRETGADVGFIDNITIYKDDRDINKNTETLNNVLHICHEWTQECYTEFDYGNKLGFLNFYKSKRGRSKKKRFKKAYAIGYRFGQRVRSEKFEVAGGNTWLCAQNPSAHKKCCF